MRPSAWTTCISRSIRPTSSIAPPPASTTRTSSRTGKLIQNRIPTANITGLNGLTGNPYPSHSTGPIYTISDSFTWIKGSHTIKFGMYYEKSGENDNDEINVSACPTCTNNQNGQFLFSDTRSGAPTTGNAIGNTAMGLFDTYSELGQRAYTIFRGSSFEPYVQDSWKASQKLTVNYGFRYTVIVPYKALWGNMIAFDPALYDPSKAVRIDPTTGAVIMRPAATAITAWSSRAPRFPIPARAVSRKPPPASFDYLHPRRQLSRLLLAYPLGPVAAARRLCLPAQ